MELFSFGDRHFEIVVVSDTNFDGLAWELWEHTNTERSNDKAYLLQIIRHDDQKGIEFKTLNSFSFPIEVLETILDNFNKTGGRKFDDAFYEE